MKVSALRRPMALPGRRVERLGGDHQRVDRGHRPTGGRAGRRSTPRWRAARGGPGPSRARCAPSPGSTSTAARACSRIVTPLASTASARPRTSAQRLDPRAVGGPGGAEHVAGGEPCACRVGVQQLDLVAPPPGLLGLGPGPGELDRGPGQRERPADAEPAVDALGRARPADLAHGLAHRGPHRRRGRIAVPTRQRRRPRWGRAPSTSHRCGRSRRTRRARPRARPLPARGRARRGSTRSRARSGRRRPPRRPP